MANLINIGTAPNDGTGDDLRDAFDKINKDNPDNLIIVKQSSDLTNIQSDKQYFLAGVIDMGTTSIDLSGGKKLSIRGADFNVSGLFSSEDNYDLITGADAGNINLFDISIEVNGTNSRVYNITSNNGFNSIEVIRINYNNCTSLGVIDSYRQGLESGTGRFGGYPTLELKGNWLSGFRISTSIVRNLASDMTEPLFKAGTGLVFNSRFLTDINCDLPSVAPLLDFSPSNFSMTDTLQLQNCIISRNGIIDPTDTTIFPNITEKDNESKWRFNVGLPNTDKGGLMTITTQATTTIPSVNTWVDVAGTFTLTKAQHVDSPANGQVRNTDETPTEFKVLSVFTLDGTANDVFEMRATVFRDATSTFEPQEVFREAINSNVGGNDIGKFVMFDSFTLNTNDYVKYQIRNTTNANNVIALLDRCKFRLEER